MYCTKKDQPTGTTTPHPKKRKTKTRKKPKQPISMVASKLKTNKTRKHPDPTYCTTPAVPTKKEQKSTPTSTKKISDKNQRTKTHTPLNKRKNHIQYMWYCTVVSSQQSLFALLTILYGIAPGGARNAKTHYLYQRTPTKTSTDKAREHYHHPSLYFLGAILLGHAPAVQ